MSAATKYIVITPVRDEESNIGFTIESMAKQTILPAEWIIVNDGSTDKTGEIIDEAAKRYAWIRPVHRTNRGFRKSGGGVVETFNSGYAQVTVHERDFVVKLDGDLGFAPDYFERCFAHFEKDPKLGVGGGTIVHTIDGKDVIDTSLKFHVRGATKIYRQKCWEQLGGLWPAPGWDTFDEVKANRLGWTTRSFTDVHLMHHKYTGSADGPWGDLVKNGRANYICGYHPLFMAVKCLRRFADKPYFIGPFALAWGYISGYLKKIPQVDDHLTIEYMRRQQMGRLFGGETIWR